MAITYFGESAGAGGPDYSRAALWFRNLNKLYTCPGSGDMFLRELSVYVRANSLGTGHVRLALYDLTNNLIYQGPSEVTVSSTSPGWVGHTGITGVILRGGQNYRIAATGDSTDVGFYYTIETSGFHTSNLTTEYTGGWPSYLANSGNEGWLKSLRAGVEPGPYTGVAGLVNEPLEIFNSRRNFFTASGWFSPLMTAAGWMWNWCLTTASSSTYTLTADAASYNETETAATLTKTSILVADTIAFTETGTGATLTKTYPIAADAGSFIETGAAATLTFGSTIFSSQWEGTGVQDSSKWSAVDDSASHLSVATDQYLQDTHSLKHNGNPNVFGIVYNAITARSTVCVRFAFRANSGGATEYLTVLELYNSGLTSDLAAIRFINASQIGCYNYGNAAYVGSNYSISLDTWYQVELKYVAGTSISWKVWDAAGGTLLSSEQTSSTNVSANQCNEIDIGAIGSGKAGTYVMWFDAFVADSAAYPGPLVSSGVTVTASVGSFTETGTDVTLTKASIVTADATAYNETGVAASLVKAYPLTASAGSYAETGTDANLLKASLVSADTTSYVESGTAASVLYGSCVAATSASFTESGVDVTLLFKSIVAASAGSFIETGTDAALRGTFILAASSTSYAETGTDVTLLRAAIVAASIGSYTETGTDVSLLFKSLVTASSTSYIETGIDASLLLKTLVDAASGSFIETGTAATLSYSNASKSVSCDPASFSESGIDVSLLLGTLVGASSTSYTESGTAASLLLKTLVSADAGSYVESGTSVGLLLKGIVACDSTSFVETGIDASLLNSKLVGASVGAFTETGIDVTLTYSNASKNVVCDPVSYAETGTDVTLTHGYPLSAAAGSFTETGTAATLTYAAIVFQSQWEGSGVKDSSTWGSESGSGSLTVATDQYLQDTHSLKCVYASQHYLQKVLSSPYTTNAGVRFAFRIASGNTLQQNIATIWGTAGHTLCFIQLDGSGHMFCGRWDSQDGYTHVGSDFTYTVGTWYQVEMLYTKNSSVKWRVWNADGTSLVHSEQTGAACYYNEQVMIFALGAISTWSGSGTYWVDSWKVVTAGYAGPYTTTNRSVLADVGSFVETGTAASIHKGYYVTCDAQSYAVTGSDVTLKGAFKLAAEAVGVILTGSVIAFGRGTNLYAGQTIVQITEYGADLYIGPVFYELTPEVQFLTPVFVPVLTFSKPELAMTFPTHDCVLQTLQARATLIIEEFQ